MLSFYKVIFFDKKYIANLVISILLYKTCFCIGLCNSDFYEINLGLTK